MKLTFIGTGSAFTMSNFQSNMLLDDSGKRLLIDCGGDARHALARVGLGARDIDALYVSHLHADHIGGIEWLGFSRYFGKGPKPDLYVNERLSHSLWEKSLRGGMASHQASSSRSTTSSAGCIASRRTAGSAGATPTANSSRPSTTWTATRSSPPTA